MKNDYEWRSPEFDNVSEQCKDLIANLLEKNPSKRLTAKKALGHAWFNFVFARPDDDGYVDEGTIMRLLNYNGKSVLKRAGLYMLCNTLGPDDVKELRE